MLSPGDIRRHWQLAVLLASFGCSRASTSSPKDAADIQNAPPKVASRTEVHVPASTPTKSSTNSDRGESASPDKLIPASKREDPRALCTACNGEWGVHGLVQRESCNCRTKDVGKRCRDGNDCEGQCIADAGDREVTSKGPPELGYFVGQCSEFVTTYGCHRLIEPGALDEGPVRLDDPPPALCLD